MQRVQDGETAQTLGQYAGPPRSFMWTGGAVHVRSVRGGKGAPAPHSHFAIQLSIGVECDAWLRGGGGDAERCAPGWLIGSDCVHGMRGTGTAVTFFFDPLSMDGRRLTARLAGVDALPLPPDGQHAISRDLEECWNRGWLVPELRGAAGRAAALLGPEVPAAAGVDSRVQAVIAELARDASGNASLRDLAAGVGLSESRLAHLFQREVGIPMRQYRLTLRMQEAIAAIARGSSLTEAAHLAGFADSSHFCRTCRRMFGTAPSNLPEFKGEI